MEDETYLQYEIFGQKITKWRGKYGENAREGRNGTGSGRYIEDGREGRNGTGSVR